MNAEVRDAAFVRELAGKKNLPFCLVKKDVPAAAKELGMTEEEARALIVSGFADNVSKELPLEYAVEMNNLIQLEMKGSIG